MDQIVVGIDKLVAGTVIRTKLYEFRFEHDAVNRLTLRTVKQFDSGTPGSTLARTEYAYYTVPNTTQAANGDHVKKITHKQGDGTTLDSVEYQRLGYLPAAEGLGNPTTITYASGSSVALTYDAALRLASESHSGSAITYTYDAAGNRRTRVEGGLTASSWLEGGQRLREVRDGPANTSSVLESYSYDDGARVTGISIGAQERTLTYSVEGQLTSHADAGVTTSYGYDAAGRRIQSTTTSAAERRFLWGPGVGTELEVMHAISGAPGATPTTRTIFVYLGRQPLMRYTMDVNHQISDVVLYLEDAMGSIVGQYNPPQGGNSATWTAFRYDAFGRLRPGSANPAATAAVGSGGEFGFHGMWKEAASGMYYARARDYDPQTGRFLQRDPYDGNVREPETLHPYVFANNNPHLYVDPTGAFSILELNVVSAKQFSLQTFKGAATTYARRKAREGITSFASEAAGNAVSTMLGFDPSGILDLLSKGNDPLVLARQFQDEAGDLLCKSLRGVEGFSDQVHTGVRVSSKASGRGPVGTPLTRGYNCNGNANLAKSTRWSTGEEYGVPDFIIGEQPILRTAPPTFGHAFTVGDFKMSMTALYDAYASPTPQRPQQFRAIVGYAKPHTYSHTALFIVGHNKNLGGVGGRKASDHEKAKIRALMTKALMNEGVIPAVITLLE